MANTSKTAGLPQRKPINMMKHEIVLLEEIRSRAFALYESRGREDGHDLDDWLLAEQEVIAPPSPLIDSGETL